MSTSEWDAAQEEYESWQFDHFRRGLLSGTDEAYSELASEVIESFQAERLTSYYVDHPQLAVPIVSMLREAKRMQDDYPRASLVFAFACVEIGLKTLLLVPILHGLIDSQPLAPLIVREYENQRSPDLQGILLSILKDYAGVDPTTYPVTPNGDLTFKESFDALRKKRNAVIHRAETASISEAWDAVRLAQIVLKVFFVGVLKELNLHLHGFDEICGRVHHVFNSIGPKFEWHPENSSALDG
jgi:hypothetical protein